MSPGLTPAMVGGRWKITLSHVSLGCLVLAWMVPFLQPYHAYPIPSFYAEWLAAAFGLSACCYFLRPSSWENFAVPLVAGAPLLLACLIFLQAALGLIGYVGQAILGAMYLAWCALLIVLGATLRQRLGAQIIASVLGWALMAGGELNALAGILQYYDIPVPFAGIVVHHPFAPAFGNLSQTNHYATYETLALVSACYLFATGKIRSATAAAVIAAPLVFALALSASRSAWLYLLAVTILAVIVRAKRPSHESRRLLRLAVGILIAFGVTQGVPTGIETTAMERVLTEPGFGIRMQHLHTAWWTFMQSPLIGVGWRNFAWYDYQYQLLFGAKDEFGLVGHAHNIIANLLAETGSMGALIVAGGALWWLIGALKGKIDLEHWWLLALLGVLAIHSMLEYPLWYAYFLGIAAFLLGMAGPTTVRNLRHFAVLGSLILLVGFVELMTLGWHYRDLERITTVDIARMDEGTIERILLRAEGEPVLRPYAEFAAVFGIPVSTDYIEDRLALNTRVMHFAPSSAVLYREAMLLAISGRHDAAMEQLGNSMRVYRGDLKPWVDLLRQHVVEFPELAPLLQLATAQGGKPQ